MEAFSDGVIAVIITVMVLEMKAPHGTDFAALRATFPVFLVYVLSFVYLGIYWNNHHHMLYAAERVDGRVLWTNLHLLFWLSLIPFTTAWMGENHFAGSSDGGVRLRAAACGDRLHDSAGFAHCRKRLGLALGASRRQRFQGPNIGAALRRRDRSRVRQPVDIRRHLRRERGSLADSRPPDRTPRPETSP